MNDIVCFHHDDLDGRAAAAVVYRQRALLQGSNFTPVSVNYDRSFPVGLCVGKETWIVDYSPSAQDMSSVKGLAASVVWIDHHKTAMEKLVNFADMWGIRTVGVSGCELTWDYVWHGTLAPAPLPVGLVPVRPLPLTLIGDRDIWAWKHGKVTRDYCNGLLSQRTDPRAEAWVARFMITRYEDAIVDTAFVGTLTAGRAVAAGLATLYREVLELAYDTELSGYPCLAVNFPSVGSFGGSSLFEGADTDADIFIEYYWTGKKYVVSLYAAPGHDVDVSVVAKHYGGGGHRGAAGFPCDELPFKIGRGR